MSSFGIQNSLIAPFLTLSTIWWKLVSMCLIFDILETPFKSCNEALLSPNRSRTAKFSSVPSILEIRYQVQIACRKAKLSAIYLASVVKLATDLCFVLRKQTALPLKDYEYISINRFSIYQIWNMVRICKSLYIFLFRYTGIANIVMIYYKVVKVRINLFPPVLYTKTNRIFDVCINLLQSRLVDQIRVGWELYQFVDQKYNIKLDVT